MKHIKPYKIFENNQQPQHLEHPGFPETEEEIHILCKKYNVENYTINNDLSIDVRGNFPHGNVILRLNDEINYIPIKFNYVSGFFGCNHNNLTSLKGCPNEVGRDFHCSHNNLKSLEYSPMYVGRDFNCYNNELETLKGCTSVINHDFNCRDNNLKSLEYLPSGIDYNSRDTNFAKNPIHKLIHTFVRKDNTEEFLNEFNEYSIVRGDKVYWSRLKAFINDFDLEMPLFDMIKKHYTIIR